jgi:hypothetical protein
MSSTNIADAKLLHRSAFVSVTTPINTTAGTANVTLMLALTNSISPAAVAIAYTGIPEFVKDKIPALGATLALGGACVSLANRVERRRVAAERLTSGN